MYTLNYMAPGRTRFDQMIGIRSDGDTYVTTKLLFASRWSSEQKAIEARDKLQAQLDAPEGTGGALKVVQR